MKNVYLILALMATVICTTAQTRVSLLEEFTGETCDPCAAYNPALDALLAQPVNAAKIIALKWQVPIPIAPTKPSSLYQTAKVEIDYRYKGIGSGAYGYEVQYSPSGNVSDGIANAPTILIDGKNQWSFGATSNHPYYLSDAIINTAASVSTPFLIKMVTAWDNTFDNCVVTVTINSSSAFSSQGDLMFRLCLVERYIEFETPPGINGEKIFHDAVRKCYPVTLSGGIVTGMGTKIMSTWNNGSQQVLTINCAVPAYITDKSQMAFVGFIQDDGDRQIYQAARTGVPSIPYDLKAGEILIPAIVCSTLIIPSVTIKNNGPAAVTALTITPALDGVVGLPVKWSGNIAGNASAIIPMTVISPSVGNHIYSYTITGVSGGDPVIANNHTMLKFLNGTIFFSTPLSEDFENQTFPPQNWLLINSGGLTSFKQGVYGNAGSFGSANYPLSTALKNETDELLLPPLDLQGTIGSELSFDLAYQQQPESKDSLLVFLSSDCGNSWVTIYANGGDSMATASLPNNSQFIPFDWDKVVIPLVSYATAAEVLIKFQIRTDGGNGLFIDNVNVKDGNGMPPGTGILESAANNVSFYLYPNPAQNEIFLRLNSISMAKTTIEIDNALGQVLYAGEVTSSKGTMAIDCSHFAEGIYLLKVKEGANVNTKRFVIGR
jgi:hypothetical protein